MLHSATLARCCPPTAGWGCGLRRPVRIDERPGDKPVIFPTSSTSPLFTPRSIFFCLPRLNLFSSSTSISAFIVYHQNGSGATHALLWEPDRPTDTLRRRSRRKQDVKGRSVTGRAIDTDCPV